MILLDTHVHIYPQFSIATVLDSALKHFSLAAKSLETNSKAEFGIVLTEGGEHAVFSLLAKQSVEPERKQFDRNDAQLRGWVITPTGDSKCLLATNHHGGSIYIYCGKQLITKENLELLSLFTTPQIVDGKYPVKELADRVYQEGGLPVLPWGVGKWTGRRKQIVADFINDQQRYPIILGDNGNRPVFWPQPEEFADTRMVLPGSDPLPLKTHQRRTGSYGVCIPGRTIEAEHPVHSLIDLILNASTLDFFGARVGSLKFLVDQFIVNVRKRIAH